MTQKYLYLHLVLKVDKDCSSMKVGDIISCPYSQNKINTINTKTGDINKLCELEFLKRLSYTERITKEQGIELRDIAIAKGHANIKDWNKWIEKIKH